jgi:hypothetical protein
MRALVLPVGLAIAFTVAAQAQERVDYINLEHRFSISFPADPMEAGFEHMAADGTVLAGTTFRAETDDGIYSVSVVVFPGDIADVAAEFEHAAAPLRTRGEIRYEGSTDYDDHPVHEINMTHNDGRQIMTSFILYERSLYFVEAIVDAGAAPPLHFMQSVSPLNDAGEAVLQ